VRSNPTAAILASLLLACGNVGAAADPQAAPAPTCDPQASNRPGYCSYPADVRAFIDMRDGCDHWRGEPWPDHADDPQEVRKKQILEAIKESCTGTDKRLSALKAAYAGDPKILQLLDEYEADIESDD
jgi:hypothetical protein